MVDLNTTSPNESVYEEPEAASENVLYAQAGDYRGNRSTARYSARECWDRIFATSQPLLEVTRRDARVTLR